MSCCSITCAKWTTLSLSVILLILGIVTVIKWNSLFHYFEMKELAVASENTEGFKMWKETPIPMYMEVYIFNWTNPDKVEKYETIKPSFVEMGPYTFYEHHIRENVVFNDNDTLTYFNKRTWKFLPDQSVGTLDEKITVLNPIVAIVGNLIKDEHYLVKRALNFFLEEKNENIAVTKTIGDLLFNGYDDPLINIAMKLNMSKIHLPFKKFGWFVDRNGSATYDGVYNMYTGNKDISKLGIITEWNYESQTSYYPDKCGLINGTSGELWYPPHSSEEISIFASDMCSNVKLHRNGSGYVHGIEGNCYEDLPTGVRNVSKCKFGAPAFISFPHFFLADPIYLNKVEGMRPDASKHATKLLIEPNTGLPLKVYAAFQLNLLLEQTEGIDVLSRINTTMMPCFWFVQKAELSDDLARLAKLMLMGGNLGTYTGYGFIGIGALLLLIYLIILKRSWRDSDQEKLIT
ncbi:hypothetical protein GWI33_016506 [Rhynchophorus ferrugineus]|uniref:Uncharacterized protein n=1 Tax=Rhynchophorus ferrugineus TaxID=354439 RepID=A0A834M3A1_RHYFE|nr:hypothetical protein GWI33_016506 [Rhynchophorus ferrugineus]